MQPPPRTGPPGASGPPPSGAVPNAFRRTRPHKHTSAAATMMGPPPATQPMTDPFAFVRQAPPPMALSSPPLAPNSNPPPMMAPPNSMYSQAGPGTAPQPQLLEGAQAAPPGPPPSSTPGVTLFTPHSATSPAVFPGHLPPGAPGYASSNTEQGYLNSSEQTPLLASGPPPMSSGPTHGQTPFNQEAQGEPNPQALPFQPVPPTSSSSQWAPDHGSRPPSVQNYFQPTSDPPPQPFNIPLQSQTYPPHTPSPHHCTPTPPTHPGHMQGVLQAPLPPQNPEPNAPQQHNSHFQAQNYFSQSAAPQGSWFNHPPQDSGYHQMGTGLGPGPAQPDPAGSQHVTAAGPVPAPAPAPAPVPYSQESGSLSMFFKGNDVENEETLAGEGKKAVNGIPGSFQHHSNTQPPPQAHSADVPVDYQGASLQDNPHIPYMNDGNYASPGNTQKPSDSQYDHVENFECVPNQEVLPSETHSSPAATSAHGGDQFETGPNLETPDSIPRPMRSASVSSNYSNVSHGSGTGSRRHQGVVGTFIQQESPRLADDVNLSAATGGYFEQIDTSPAGDMGAYQSSQERMYHSQPPTPSPPKPTGIFQASANSSFEPVRSHGVGVRPVEVDRAKMVAEGGADSIPGNLEQPPDNLENIYGSGQPLPAGDGGGVPHLSHPVVHSHSRPSSRAHGANQPCESPATTLWAQNDPSSLGANILLAPAAPPVLAPLREPSADVIQPPEDGPLDLQPPLRAQPTSQHHSENLENPPKVSEGELSDSQGNLGYASLLVSDSLHQPVLIAPPVSNYNVIPPSTLTQAASQSSLREATPPVRPLSQGQGASTSQTCHVTSNQNPLFTPAPVILTPSASTQSPLNLTRDNTEGTKSDITALPPSQPARPPLSRGQSLGGDSHSALHINAQAPPVAAAAAPSNHNQPSNFELLDFSMHQSQNQNQASSHPSCLQGSPQASNAPGFYLQVTKDAQQGVRVEGDIPLQPPASSSAPQVPAAPQQAAPNTQQPLPEPPKVSESQREGYDEQWRYYPGYDPSFDDDYHRQRDPYGDDFDRRSIHSEQSAHSIHSSRGHHSRRSSFSSRSQQSQVYRSQPDLVSAVYDNTVSTLPVDYSYGQYPDQTDAAQNYSQYPYSSEYTADGTWIAPEQPTPRPTTPEKFTIPHRCARFGPGGHLVQVLPNLPSAGQPALVDIHNLETMLQDTPEQSELRAFPGPLVKEETHKVDVIKFSQNKALECSRNNDLLDRDSACLLWDLIVLLCRQNGTVVGTDIADLLLKEHRSVWLPGKSPNEANLIDFNNEPLARAEEEPGAGPLSLLSDTFMTVPENVGKETERFRELLLFGRKKDALEAAMKGGLWGHALLLASKMDNRTHARVMTRFANSLPINDPLQTVYQLMSGRMPASATCCGEEKWGDWRPHLAMVLSNLAHTPDLDKRTITTMGDTLASKGLNDAAHFCYLMAQVGLGVFTKKSTKMVLVGSNHSLSFYQFATNEAIQRTEAYEYAQSLGSQCCSLPNFQVFKLIYACRLAEAGLSAQAFHYCEVISRVVLMQPSYHSPVFISQLIQMAEKLRFFDPQLKEKPEQELFNEPEWLIQLRQLDGQIRVRERTLVVTVCMNSTHHSIFFYCQIVWDEQKQRWVDLNEPEEESKPPPPPPSGFPKMVHMPGPAGPASPPGGGPPVNMFSRKAGTKSRYVDVLNPSRTAKPGGLAPAPADIFAPLAPMPMPANLFVPSSGMYHMFNPTLPPGPEGPPMPDGSQSGESVTLATIVPSCYH
uniref:Protein transport protein sec16 n=1 Tax=Myripristis murdjan TaxID=586833 RepID=A0A667WL62_9TELE